jgi:hypothetical protein
MCQANGKSTQPDLTFIVKLSSPSQDDVCVHAHRPDKESSGCKSERRERDLCCHLVAQTDKKSGAATCGR